MLRVRAVASAAPNLRTGRAMKVRPALRRRELHTMPLTTLRRYLVPGVLAAALTLAGAAPANARDLGTPYHAWFWLQDVWTQGVSVLWGWHAREAPSSGRTSGLVPINAKEGWGLDPNGSAQTNSTSPVCGTCGDQGLSLRPNG